MHLNATISRSVLKIAFLLVLALAGPLWAEDHYFPPGGFDAVALLAPPPRPDSGEQAADLQQAREVVKTRTPAEAARARTDMTLSMASFAQAIGPFFQPEKLPKTQAFLVKIKKEIHAPLYRAKDYWKRPRPYQLDARLAFGKPEESYSYPSGHSTVATVDALVLAELFPDKREAILAQGRQIGWDRVLTGYHFLTDVEAGRVLGQAFVHEMMTNATFQHDLAEVRAEIAAVRAH